MSSFPCFYPTICFGSSSASVYWRELWTDLNLYEYCAASHTHLKSHMLPISLEALNIPFAYHYSESTLSGIWAQHGHSDLWEFVYVKAQKYQEDLGTCYPRNLPSHVRSVLKTLPSVKKHFSLYLWLYVCMHYLSTKDTNWGGRWVRMEAVEVWFEAIIFKLVF